MDFLDLLPFTTTKIEATTNTGQLSTGTGFFFAFNSDQQQSSIPVLITNRHMVENMISITIKITTKKNNLPQIGNYLPFTIELNKNNMIMHPNKGIDLSIIILAPYIGSHIKSLFIPYLSKENIATEKELQHINILHDIIMVGYPDGISDEINNMPIFRKGITATNPSIDYNGHHEFLIDASCFPGSSGSPVMSYENGMVRDADGNFTINYGAKLIGIQAKTFLHNSNGKIVPIEIPTQVIPGVITSIPNNLGIVVKASCILDFESLLPPH